MEPETNNDGPPKQRSTLRFLGARVIAAFVMAFLISFRSFRGLTTETYYQHRIRQILVDSENAIAPTIVSVSSSSNLRLPTTTLPESFYESKSTNVQPNTTAIQQPPIQPSSSAGSLPANNGTKSKSRLPPNPTRVPDGPIFESVSNFHRNLPPNETQIEQRRIWQQRLGLSNITRWEENSDIDLGIDFGFDFDANISTLQLLYLHVGKTGGTSLDKVLRANCKYYANKLSRKVCEAGLLGANDHTANHTNTGKDGNGGELLLSRVTKKTAHTRRPRDMDQYLSHWLLWTARNPIDRAVSAFDMRHADNDRRAKPGFNDQWILYKLCGFDTAQDLADALEFDTSWNHSNSTTTNSTRPRTLQIPDDSSTNETENLDCHEHGRETLEGYGDKSHLYFNYAHYLRYVQNFPNTTPNFVLRTEHLWDDVLQTNGLLTLAEAAEQRTLAVERQDLPNATQVAPPPLWISKVNDVSDHKHTHGSQNYKVRSKLTKRGKEVFCCYLSDENRIYEDLLRSAVNLSDRQTTESLESLYRDCGILPSEPMGGANETARSAKTSRIVSSSRFGWREWRSNGCPRHTAAQTNKFFTLIQ